jgi:hypothetical protein
MGRSGLFEGRAVAPRDTADINNTRRVRSNQQESDEQCYTAGPSRTAIHNVQNPHNSPAPVVSIDKHIVLEGRRNLIIMSVANNHHTRR